MSLPSGENRWLKMLPESKCVNCFAGASRKRGNSHKLGVPFLKSDATSERLSGPQVERPPLGSEVTGILNIHCSAAVSVDTILMTAVPSFSKPENLMWRWSGDGTGPVGAMRLLICDGVPPAIRP